MREMAMDMSVAAVDGAYRLELRDVRPEAGSTYRSILRLVMPDRVLKHPFWFERADALEFLAASQGLDRGDGRAEFSASGRPDWLWLRRRSGEWVLGVEFFDFGDSDGEVSIEFAAVRGTRSRSYWRASAVS
jgi:hypothetical protein